MRAARQIVLALAAPFALTTPFALAAQGSAAAPTKSAIVTAARDVMTRARYATLATNGPAGQP